MNSQQKWIAFHLLIGFDGYLEIFKHVEEESNVFRFIVDFKSTDSGNYETLNEYLKTDNGYYVNTDGGVLLAQMSFRLTDNTVQLDDETFALKDSSDSPTTGVKIAKTSEDFYTDPSVFRFAVITKGTVSGSITTNNSSHIYTAVVKAYPAGTVDWVNMTNHTGLDEKVPAGIVTTNNDGTYSLELEQGKYDILIDKAGHIDQIYTNVEVMRNTDYALGEMRLIPGDINKDGNVELEDMDELFQNYGKMSTDSGYQIGLDFTEDNIIELEEMDLFVQNYGAQRTIINKGGE